MNNFEIYVLVALAVLVFLICVLMNVIDEIKRILLNDYWDKKEHYKKDNSDLIRELSVIDERIEVIKDSIGQIKSDVELMVEPRRVAIREELNDETYYEK